MYAAEPEVILRNFSKKTDAMLILALTSNKQVQIGILKVESLAEIKIGKRTFE
jgi:hypothetical protein